MRKLKGGKNETIDSSEVRKYIASVSNDSVQANDMEIDGQEDSESVPKVCPLCSGTHRYIAPGSYVAVECPKCKNILTSSIIANILDIEVEPTDFERLMIPMKYRNKAFNASKIENIVNADPDTVDSKIYMRILREVYSAVSVGSPYCTSLLIYSPMGCGKDEFVFTCMQLALNNNLTVAPYLDTNQIDQVMVNMGRSITAESRMKLEGIEKFTLNDIVNPDYCFIKIKLAGVNLKRDIQILQMIVDQRARMGKATIILSNFPLYYLISAEKTLDRFCVRQQEPYEFERPYYVELKTNYTRNNYNTKAYNNAGGGTNPNASATNNTNK